MKKFFKKWIIATLIIFVAINIFAILYDSYFYFLAFVLIWSLVGALFSIAVMGIFWLVLNKVRGNKLKNSEKIISIIMMLPFVFAAILVVNTIHKILIN